MRAHRRAIALLVTALVAALALTGCAGDPWTQPRTTPSAIGTPAPGFAPSATPSPEATITPVAGSWAGVHPSPGYRVVLLTAGDSAPTQTLVTEIRRWADEERVDLRTIVADEDHVGAIVEAIGMDPDLIVSAGDDLVDPLALVTASHLDQQFLIVGAEVAEPTANVTAADWTGASFRGEGLGMSSQYDAATFTPERCAAAVRAGVTAVLTGLTGIVLWLD